KVDIRTHPPKQHSGPKGKPDSGSDELKLTQAEDRLEPRPYGDAKGEPEEQHYGNENRSYETHFPSFLPVAFSWDHVPLGGVEAARRSARFLGAKNSTL